MGVRMGVSLASACRSVFCRKRLPAEVRSAALYRRINSSGTALERFVMT
jgi:hypothetical protein